MDQTVALVLGVVFVAVVVTVLVDEVWFRLTGKRFLPHGPGPGDFKPGSCPDCGHLRVEQNERIPADVFRRPIASECRAEIESSGWGGDYCSCRSAFHGG